MNLNDFQIKAIETDNIKWEDNNGLDIALLGIIGEMGSVAGVIKKKQRDGNAYTSFKEDLKEELGDLLWYIAVTAYRLEIVFTFNIKTESDISPTHLICKIQNYVNKLINYENILVYLSTGKNDDKKNIAIIFESIITVINSIAAHYDFDISNIAKKNIIKTVSFFKGNTSLPARQFDGTCHHYEILPRQFKIEFIEAGKGKSIMQMKGVNIGDKITDNSYENDGYRFHDVFHLANAATLGWSPVLRRMLHRKRKSDPDKDEKDDGARAAIVEELVVNLIFNYVELNSFLEHTQSVDIGVLKQIVKLVRGLEVKELEPWEWRHCIVEGCRIFREIKEHKSGIVTIDAEKRSITYKQA